MHFTILFFLAIFSAWSEGVTIDEHNRQEVGIQDLDDENFLIPQIKMDYLRKSIKMIFGPQSPFLKELDDIQSKMAIYSNDVKRRMKVFDLKSKKELSEQSHDER